MAEANNENNTKPGEAGSSADSAAAAPPAPATAPAAPDDTSTAEKEFKPITSQEAFDAMVKDRIGRLNDSIAQITKERDEEKRRADEAEAANAANAEKRQIDEWKQQVAEKTGLDASVLRGETLEDIQAHAESIRALIPTAPVVASEGHGQPGANVTKEQILAIEDMEERQQAIAAHIDLF